MTTIHARISLACAESPKRTAVVSAGRILTYAELEIDIALLASKLIRAGVSIEDRVAIYSQRSPESVIAMIATMRAGGCFVPISSEYPTERVNYMLRDSGALFIISDSPIPAEISTYGMTVLSTTSLVEDRCELLHGPTIDEENAAYIIYTSGTTGTPKGVVVTHANATNLVTEQTFVRFAPDQVFLQLSPLAFDASAFEIWGALTNGASLVIPADSYRALDGLANTIADYRVTVLFITPALFHELSESRPTVFDSLETIIVGGDVLSPIAVARVRQTHPGSLRIVNGYGPSEATTFATTHLLNVAEDPIPIGRPIRGVRAYILNSDLSLVKSGMEGDLWLAGLGVTRGYIGNSALTATRFLPDLQDPGKRMYNTGDRAMMNENHVILFSGREDRQAKIRGFRIELDGVEEAIRAVPGVQDVAVVVAKLTNSNKQIHAFVVLREFATVEELVRKLRVVLPRHEIPTKITAVNKIEVSMSGKIERRSLTGRLGEDSAHVDDDLLRLKTIIQDILRLESVEDDDDFFALGGDSILAIRLVNRAEEVGIALSLVDIFTDARVSALSRASYRATVAVQSATGHASPTYSDQSGISVETSEAGGYVVDDLERKLAAVFESVLDVVGVTPEDDFFSLGGDSILAIRLVNGARDQGVPIDLIDVFTDPGIVALAEAAKVNLVQPTRRMGAATRSNSETKPGSVPEVLDSSVVARIDATELQLGIIFEGQSARESGLYLDVIAHRVDELWDESAFQLASRKLSASQPALRTRFDLAAEYPQQLILRNGISNASYFYATTADPVDEAAELSVLAVQMVEGLGESQGPLFRMAAYVRIDGHFYVMFAFHHAILDGWSETLLLAEFLKFYSSKAEVDTGRTSAIEGVLRDFSRLEREAVESPLSQKYWQSYVAELPTVGALHNVGNRETTRREVTLSTTMSAALHQLSRSLRVSMKTILLAGHMGAVAAFFKTNIPVAGVAVHGRPESRAGEFTAGLFTNLLPFGLDVSEMDWMGLVRQVRAYERSSFEHRRFPYPEIKNIAGGPIFSNLFNYVRFHTLSTSAETGEHSQETLRWDANSIPFTVDYSDSPDSDEAVVVLVAADAGLFSLVSLGSFLTIAQSALAAMIANPFAGVSDVPQ